jgi:hypothetical protein
MSFAQVEISEQVQEIDSQLNNEKSGFVKCILVKYKCLLVTMLVFICTIQAVQFILSQVGDSALIKCLQNKTI